MIKKSFLNLDVNAGWGVDPELWPYLETVLRDSINPSSIHQAGQKARFQIEEARANIKKFISAEKARVIFTSGASESNNQILNSVFSPLIANGEPAHLIISAIEHMSLLEPASKLSEKGVSLTTIHPRSLSAFEPQDFVEALRPETKMISLMFANNETGDVLPLRDVIEAVRAVRPDILIHSDVVQALGKTTFNFAELDLDAVSISAHKLGGLPGVGALVIKDDLDILPLIHGGPQESRFRAGTENLPGIVSFGYIAAKLSQSNDSRLSKMKSNAALLKELIFGRVPDLKLNRFHRETLPNTINIQVPSLRSDDLVVALDLQGLLISSAAACSSGKPLPSHVLLAQGLSESEARQSIRISVSDQNSEKEIRDAAHKIVDCITFMRSNLSNSQEAAHVS